MARHTTLAAVSGFPLRLDGSTPPERVTDIMIEHWRERLETVIHLRPDLVVLPEQCDRPWMASYPRDLLEQYYDDRQDRFLDFLASIAREYRTNIAYSGRRVASSGRYNATQVMDRSGTIVGVYDKCYLTEGEHQRSGMTPGDGPRLIQLDFGTVAPAICFDLNFDELLTDVAELEPDVIAFSSNFHGGPLQGHWAYTARSYFVGSICPPSPSAILDPFGDPVASSTNYRHEALAVVNLDSALVHIDFNGRKFNAIRREYGPDVRIKDPGRIGVVEITAEREGLSVDEVIERFELVRLDDYFRRVRGHRRHRRDGSAVTAAEQEV